MLSLIFVLFITAASSVFLGCILDVPGSRLRTLETGVGKLVSVSVTVVDARTIPIVPSARWNLLPPGTLTRRTYTAT